MSYTLVGSLGTVVTGAAGASVNPAFGQSPGAGNILILWVAGGEVATFPTAPAGWVLAKQGGLTTESASIFYRYSAGGDTAPTVAAVTSAVLNAQLGEFTLERGVAGAINEVQGTNNAGASFALGNAHERAPGQLIVYALSSRYSVAGSVSNSVSAVSNGGTANDTNNNGSSVADHYVLGYILNTKTNAGNQNMTFTQTTTNISNGSAVWVSFQLPDPERPFRMPLGA